MFKCKHVFFSPPNFPQFSQYLYLTDSHRAQPTLTEYTHLHAHSQTDRQTLIHAHTHTHTHSHAPTDTRRFNVKKQSSVEWCSSSAQLCFSSGDVEDACDSTESHTSLLRPSSVCNLISGYWLSLLSVTSHKVSSRLMSPVSIAMG